MPANPTTTRLPILFLAGLVLGLEALAAVGYGLVQIPQVRASRLTGLGAILMLLGYAVVLVLLARGVARGQRWARGPAVVTQLLQGLLAFSFTGGATQGTALVLGATALVVLGCLLSPGATSVFLADDAQRDSDPVPPTQ